MILVLIALAGGIVSVVNIVYPIKAIGFKSRKRAALILASSFILLIVAGIALNNSKEGQVTVGSSWLWIILFLITAFGLVRLIRRRTGKKNARATVALHPAPSGSDTAPAGSTRIRTRTDVMSAKSRSVTVGSVRQNRTASNSGVRWIGPSDAATVVGRNIGGMIYLGPEPRRERWERESAPSIDPGLPVARVGSDFSGESLPYWPSYSDIDPQARATYLDWLAGERSGKQYGPGYVFLYFYGIERRFFVDSPDQDEKRLLVAEVERLLSVYGENRSVRRYLEAFLDAARIVLEPAGETEPRFERSGHELSLGLRVPIGRMANEGRPLSADWILAWYITHPEMRTRTPMARAFPEFRALFTLLFNEKFPAGLKIRVPKRLIRARYVAASGAFETDLNGCFGDIPDISRITKPLTTVKSLVEETVGALEKYSRFLGRKQEGRDTIEAHALLPECLWSLFPNTEMEGLRRWAEEIIETSGFSPVDKVIERLEGTSTEKVGKRQLTGAADALARLSIGMAPDPRFALRSPKPSEPVVLFRLPEGLTALEEVSKAYKDILVVIALGSFVAHADGTIIAKERDALEARIDATELSEAERTPPSCKSPVDAVDPTRSGSAPATFEGRLGKRSS